MKKSIIAYLLLATAAVNTVSAQELLDKIVAIVENEVVTQRELSLGVNTMRRQLVRQDTESIDEKELVAKVLQQIITRKLQLQEAQRLGIEIDEITLDRALENLAQQNDLTLVQLKTKVEADGGDFSILREQIRKKLTIDQLTRREVFDKIEISDREIRNYLMGKSDNENIEYHIAEWQTALKKKGTDETKIKQGVAFLQKILSSEKISSFSFLRKRIHETWGDFWQARDTEKQAIPRYTLRNIHWKKVEELPAPAHDYVESMAEKQITAPIQYANKLHLFYLLGVRNHEHAVTRKQYHVKHLLMQTNLLDDDEVVRRRLEKIKHLIEEEGNFEYFARKFSKDPGSSFKGGDLGWSYPSNFVPEFAEAVIEAEKSNEIIGPFRTSFGWHLLEVVGIREEDVGDEKARHEAITQIKRSKAEEELRLWLLRLRENRYIEVRI